MVLVMGWMALLQSQVIKCSAVKGTSLGGTTVCSCRVLVVSSTGRTFELDTGSELFLVNSTELRHVNIELDLVPPLEPAVRRSSRGMTRAQSSGGRVLNRKYTLPIELEQAILGDCNWDCIKCNPNE